jgi:TM2 domain-containing membrane protein YozV
MGKQFSRIINKKNNSQDKIQIDISRLYQIDALLSSNQISTLNKKLFCHLNQTDKMLNDFFFKRRLIYKLLKTEQEGFNIIKKKQAFSKYYELIDYTEKEKNKFKNKAMATFAGIIPGLGYFYAGQKATGLVTLAVITIGSLISGTAFLTGNKAIGFFTGGVSFLFYSGSIMGGYLAAKKHNRKLNQNLKQHLYKEMNLNQDREYLFNKYGL